MGIGRTFPVKITALLKLSGLAVVKHLVREAWGECSSTFGHRVPGAAVLRIDSDIFSELHYPS